MKQRTYAALDALMQPVRLESKMKTVHKFRTGHPVPDGAIYLCTQVETETISESTPLSERNPDGLRIATGSQTHNRFVWHYFLVAPTVDALQDSDPNPLARLVWEWLTEGSQNAWIDAARPASPPVGAAPTREDTP